MPLLHDPATRDALKLRVAALRPDTARRWGRMTVDQMLWHVNCGLENALGRFVVKEQRLPIPGPVIKFLAMNLPWRRGNTPTAPEFVAKESYDFAAEQARLQRLIDEMSARPIEGTWPDNSFMGRMTGTDWSRFQFKHLDHHLTQFGA